jgi:hypothetical protein
MYGQVFWIEFKLLFFKFPSALQAFGNLVPKYRQGLVQTFSVGVVTENGN